MHQTARIHPSPVAHRPTMALLATLALGACRAAGPASGPAPAPAAEPPRTVQPGAPGEATRVLRPDQLSAIVPAAHNEADVRFMHGMI
ncbi:MAG: hypothetical protein ABR551_14450, partial [Gemmatimonadales bacterium]